jgi:hypothetical protein
VEGGQVVLPDEHQVMEEMEREDEEDEQDHDDVEEVGHGESSN